MMSLMTQPAGRMTAAPTKNRKRRKGEGHSGLARAVAHQQGHISNHTPIGLSARASFSQGRKIRGARVSTQVDAEGWGALSLVVVI